MGRTRVSQPSQPAQPPKQDQENEQLIEVIAICRPCKPVSPEELSAFEEESRRCLALPLPEGDDFAHEPPCEPYDPKIDSRYEWARPEAWIKEKDGEGRTVWRNRFTQSLRYSTPRGVRDEEDSQSTAQQHEQQRVEDRDVERS